MSDVSKMFKYEWIHADYYTQHLSTKKTPKVFVLLEKLSKRHHQFVKSNYSNDANQGAGTLISSEPTYLPTHVPLKLHAKWGSKDTVYVN